ncbi:hypothetical protein ACFW04_010272 [Cataglyphis niger]
MRQVVVLEPAGSVLVIRQTSLGNNGGNVGTNSTGTNDTHALVNHAAVPTIASNDHNQNRIVVVRSSTSSTCMTNSEIAAILISFQRHTEWQSREVKVRPRSGSMLLYSRKKVRYRRDGYCWKKRKDGKTTREDHMKLKVQGVECIYGCYVHSAILPTFHRRCYWLLQNPDVVLVHYLNVPYPDGDAKLAALPPCLALPPDKKEWTRDELASQLRPMFLGGDDDPNNPHLTQHSNHPVDMIVSQLLDRQRASSTSSTSSTQLAPRRLTPDNQVSSTTGGQQPSTTATPAPRVYSRHSHSTQSQQPAPLVLSLQQIQGGGGLLILNSQPYHHQQQQQQQPQQQQPQQQQQQQQQQSQQQQQPQQQNQQVEMQQVTEQQLVPQTSVDREQQTQQEIEAQENMDRSAVQSLPIGGSGSEVTDFAETLDLSQEDIQKTLSANMVPPSPSPSPADNSMINPMDFIDSSDDVLVNLDAFDVFGDLPELHDFEADQTKHEEQRGPENDVGCHPGTTVHIAEYSPEWSYTEGGVKVLVAGPWTGGSGSQSYSVLFDAEPVEACLVQPGVLRCRCPAHAPGIASLQVACDGFVVSDSVAFEYRRAPTSEPSPEKALLDRLADVEARLQGPGPPSPAAHLEERLVAYCQDAVVRPWRAGAEPLQSGGPTLLHLAAGLGYSRLACALLHWRAENPSSVLDAEVDALRQDSAGLTPLAWACAAGHADTARILYRWNAMALRVRDCQNRTATELAAENGHAAIAEELNQLEARRQDERLFLRPASPSPRRPSQDSGLDLALWEEDARVLTLAEQIIAALPERIKRAEGDSPSSSSPPPLTAPLSPLEDALMEQMPLDSGELFDSYRDCNGGAASISDADADASPSSPSSSCLTPDSPSPPPTTADFCEFLQLQLHLDGNAHNGHSFYSPNSGERRLNGMIGSGALSATSDGGSEADLSRLTLSDREQRELYHAARMIQKAYRNYKGRQRQEEAERHAAVLIQQYYRRHKQYAYHRQATKAALVIQNNYRNYRSRPGSTSMRQQAVHQQAAHQAARKIQQFMRQSKIKLQNARAAANGNGRPPAVTSRAAAVPQSSPSSSPGASLAAASQGVT